MQPEIGIARCSVWRVVWRAYGAGFEHYNDRLTCDVDIVGISNFVTFLGNTREYRRHLRRPEYSDERDPNMPE